MTPHKPTLRRAVKFGMELIRTQDLDPVYPAALALRQETKPLTFTRWLLAYMCFYQAATACWIASARSTEDYWTRFLRAAQSKDYPRSSERRHFRGKACYNAVLWYSNHLNLRTWGSELANCETYDDVARNLARLPLFGSWAYFKLADLLERTGVADISFSEATLAMYKDPAQGARLLMTGELAEADSQYLGPAVQSLAREFKGVEAPPLAGSSREVGLQELETILCKYKSHWRGHYRVGKDITEVRHGFVTFPQKSHEQNGPLARVFLSGLPAEVGP